jgi:hypothetical protein
LRVSLDDGAVWLVFVVGTKRFKAFLIFPRLSQNFDKRR